MPGKFDPVRDADKSLAVKHPGLVAEWHPTLNGELTAEAVSASSDKRVWWRRRCVAEEVPHEWPARIADRSGGSGCPVCTGRRVQVGVNDLASLHPDLAAEWHPTRNGDLTPTAVTTGASRPKVWWQRACIPGQDPHEWEAAVGDRARRGDGCAVCRGFQIQVGGNDLATVRPDLAAEWHPTRNGNQGPTGVTQFANRVVWWQRECVRGQIPHEWATTVANRSTGYGCPVCIGAHVQAGVNDLATLRPDLAAEWHPARNGDFTPLQVTVSSSREAWWQRECVSGEVPHQWQATVVNQSTFGTCSVCRGRKVQVGVNDLATVRPDLATEWHPTRNGELTPTKVTRHSMREVWWQRECVPDQTAHEWNDTVTHRNTDGGCHVCSGRKIQVGVNDLATLRPELAAEWHPTRNGDFTPAKVTEFSLREMWWQRECVPGETVHEWKSTIANRSTGHGCAVCNGRQVQVGVNDLATVRPDHAAEWHPTRNGDLTAREVTRSSMREVWWQRECIPGEAPHEWRALVNHRSSGNECAVCHGLQVQMGVNDLATVRPDLAAEWHPARNGDLTSSQVTAGAARKVWWLRKCDPNQPAHEWQANIVTRSNGGGCSVCHGYQVQVGVNDLATVRPDLAAEWHPTGNGDLAPTDVTVASNRKVWWQRECAPGVEPHEWHVRIASRSTNGSGCPMCRQSRGEAAVARYLDQHGITYEREWSPSSLGRLRFDFALPIHKTLIEFDGIQHRQPVRWSVRTTEAEAREAFARVQERDARKDQWAAAWGWLLVRLDDHSTVGASLNNILDVAAPADRCGSSG
jgi:very-short-patch-repair endonuclease